MDRKTLIKFIPKPENKDVIVYDTSLVDLIDINVFEEYYKLLPLFLDKKNQLNNINNKIEEYNNTINNIYLYKKNWTKEDYLQVLQNNKKTYSTMFYNIKKTEDNISVLHKKVNNMNEKINIQKIREEKDLQNKLNNIDSEIKHNKNSLLKLEDNLEEEKHQLKNIQESIESNEEEFNMLQKMAEELKSGTYICKYCGSRIRNVKETSPIFEILNKNLRNNKTELTRLLKKQNKRELNIAYYEDERKKIKAELNNDIEFKQQNRTFYQKKSLEILKLEALRDEAINNISTLEKQLKNDSQFKSKEYLSLKDLINKYELSLNNLKKIEDMKVDIKKDLDSLNNLKAEVNNMEQQINKYLKFITIFYKIYQQKATEYFGKDFIFKLFKIENFEIKEDFIIFYKNIEYDNLDETTKNKIDKFFIEKIDIYD